MNNLKKICIAPILIYVIGSILTPIFLYKDGFNALFPTWVILFSFGVLILSVLSFFIGAIIICKKEKKNE